MNEDAKETRVPPPAFPPGSRRDVAERAGALHGDRAPSRPGHDADSGAEGLPGLELISGTAEGEVVGMDFNPHLSHREMVSRGDPHVLGLIEAVDKLAESLRRRGEAGLHATPDMSRFEATLRAYCVGYLAGRRAEDG